MSLAFDFNFSENPEVSADNARYATWAEGYHLVQIVDGGIHTKTDSMGEVSKSIWVEYASEKDATLTTRDYFVYTSRNANSIDKSVQEKALKGIQISMSRYALVCQCIGLPEPTNDLSKVFGQKLVLKIQLKNNVWYDKQGNERSGVRADVVDRFPPSDWDKLSAENSYPKFTQGSVAQPPSAKPSAYSFTAGKSAASSPAVPQGAPASNGSAEAQQMMEDDVPF